MIDLSRRLPPSLRTIRAKLLAYALAFLVVPTVLYGVFFFRASRNALLPVRKELLTADALLARRSLRQLVEANARQVSAWARLDEVRELAGNEIGEKASHFLTAAREKHPSYLDLVVIRRDGVCVSASSPALLGRSFGTGVPREVRASPSAVRYSPEHDAFYLELWAPIPDPDHPTRRLGRLVAFLGLDSLRAALQMDAQPRLSLLVLSEADRLVVGPRQPRAGGTSLPVWRMAPAGGDVRSASGGRVYRTRDPRGQEVIVSEVPLRISLFGQTVHWRVVASVPAEMQLTPLAALGTRSLLIGLGLTLIGVVAAWNLSLNLSRPVQVLTGITSRIAETGVLERVPDSTTNDEIGELSRSFQSMVEKLQVAHEEVVQSAKLAFLGELAAGIAHEIRTPLGIIKSSAQLLLRRMSAEGRDDGREFAHFIYEESDRLNAVVTSILDFARPSPLLTVPTDVSEIARRATHFLASKAGEKHVHLDIEGCAEPLLAECDGRQIYQVCLNIIMNAIRACPKGGRVEVSTSCSDGRVEIAVRDEGAGIPAELQQRLFEPFVSQQQGGVGLGLAIVKRIVEAHGGTVEAKNRPAGGALFQVYIPVAPRGEGVSA